MERALPTLELPRGMVRLVPSHECLAEADNCEALAADCFDPKMRRYLLREARAWRKLAAERA